MKRPPRRAWLALGVLPVAFLTLAACAQTPLKDAGKYPELTPEEVGRRVLAFLAETESLERVTHESLSAHTELPLKYAPEAKVYAFTLKQLTAGWYYSVTFEPAGASRKGMLWYEFQNTDNPRADMTPVCKLDFDGYAKGLKDAGFAVGVDYTDIGQVVEYIFRRGDLFVRIATRIESVAPGGVDSRACVEHLTAYQTAEDPRSAP